MYFVREDDEALHWAPPLYVWFAVFFALVDVGVFFAVGILWVDAVAVSEEEAWHGEVTTYSEEPVWLSVPWVRE